MGTILQEQVAQRCGERVSSREGKWKKDLWSIAGPNAGSNKMGRRQSQRKPTPPRHAFPSQENNSEKRLPQRRKHKSNTSSAKRNTSQHSAHRSSEPKPLPVSPTEGRMEPKVLPVAKRCSHRRRKHTGSRESKHTAAVSYHCLSGCSPEQLERHSPGLEVDRLSRHGEDDSDTDLSESERLPVSVCSRVPPQLELRPEVIKAEERSSRSHRTNLQGHGGFDFPDFLPPPFNSWSLSQLAVFYNMEGRGTPRPRPVGPLERYLERLLQLEWRQIQTIQEESGKSAVSEVISSCHRSPAAATSRLSSPKCILQCQRAFPLTFLSSLASHSALLTGCACTLCRIRCSRCSTPCSCSTYSHTRQSRPSAALEPKILPKRSYSESRVHSSDRGSQAQRFRSPVRTNNHLRRMQASGNIRNPVQGAATSLQHTASECNEVVWRGDVLDYRMSDFRRRSGSEQRRGGGDRKQNGSEKKRSGSECRKGGAERRRAAYLKEQEIKPDAVTAIIDNLPGSKFSPIRKPSRPKQVEFVT